MQIHTHTHIRRLIVTTTWNILHGTYLRYKHLNNKISLSYYGRLMLPIVVRFLINSIFQYFRWISEIFCPLMFFPLCCHSIPFIHSVSISIYNLCHIELRMDFRFSRTIRSLLRYIGTHCTHSVSVCACVFVSRPSYVVCGWKEMWNVWHNQNDQKYYWWNFSCWFWFDAFVVIFLLVSPTPAPYSLFCCCCFSSNNIRSHRGLNHLIRLRTLDICWQTITDNDDEEAKILQHELKMDQYALTHTTNTRTLHAHISYQPSGPNRQFLKNSQTKKRKQHRKILSVIDQKTFLMCVILVKNPSK